MSESENATEKKAARAAYMREYRRRHPEYAESQRANLRDWKAAHPERVHEAEKRRTARRAARGSRRRATQTPCVRCGSTDRYPSGACKACTREAYKAWEARDPEHARALVNERNRRFRERLSRDEHVRRNRQNNLTRALKKFGLTREQYDAMVEAQGGVCALCGQPPDGRRQGQVHRHLHIDHDHVTGATRALLCGACNIALGGFDDDPILLRAAADYVERYRAAPC